MAERGTAHLKRWVLLVALIVIPRCSCNGCWGGDTGGCSFGLGFGGGGCTSDYSPSCPDVVPAGTHTINTVDGFGTCKLICETGWNDCDKNPNNGCETAGACPTLDGSLPAPELVTTLNGAPRGLAACKGLVYFFDDDELDVVDGTSRSPVFVTPNAPIDGLACDDSNVYFATPSDADGGTPTGTIWAVAHYDGTVTSLATNVDPGRGIDTRDARVYWIARTGYGRPMLSYVTLDGGGFVTPALPAVETDAYKSFALATSGDYSLSGDAIWFAGLDGGAPFALPDDAGSTSSLLTRGDSLFAIAHGLFGFYDAGTDAAIEAGDDASTDAPEDVNGDVDDAQSEADASQYTPTDTIVALGSKPHVVVAGMTRIIASTATKVAIIASDNAVAVVDLDLGTVQPFTTTALHVVDVATDGKYAYWTTLGQGTVPGAVWRAALP